MELLGLGDFMIALVSRRSFGPGLVVASSGRRITLATSSTATRSRVSGSHAVAGPSAYRIAWMFSRICRDDGLGPS